jgi:poly-gamma-glutamate capsule biosynthesis protein CapA/YwtB (metallophosphatase superfamily)
MNRLPRLRIRRLSALVLLSLGLLLALPLAGQTPAPPRRQTMLFAGDVMLSRTVGKRMKAEDDWKYPFEKIAPTLREADLAFANLECPVSDVGKNKGHLYSFRADPRAIEGLTFAGFDVLSVANNHMYDWGRPALVDTMDRLRAAGIKPVGAGRNDLEAHYPVLVNLHGVRIAFLAYVDVPPREATAGLDTPGVAWLDPERALEDIRFARPLADLVIVSLHWGIEYTRKPQRSQVELAHKMIDAGADLIVGGHPHVVQPLEEYHGRYIAYSLGNFIFDQHDQPTHHGLMLRVTLEGKKISTVEGIPIDIDGTLQAVVSPESKLAQKDQLAGKPAPASAQ